MPLRPLRAREVIARLDRAGFLVIRQRGSHARLGHEDGRRVTVPIHTGDVPTRALRSIIRQAGLTEEQWEEM